MRANLLITSMLDEKWTDVYIDIVGSDIKISRDGGELIYFGTKKYKEEPHKKTLLFTIHHYNIMGLERDIDNMGLRIDCRSNYHNMLGYFQIKFKDQIDYTETVRQLESSSHFKNIVWTNRTKEQDKRFG